jgi:hypothetical protein
MQLMPGTARRLERVSKNRLVDPRTNIRIGIKYFAQLVEQFNGDAELALAAYNAGPERAETWVKRYPVQERLLFLDLIPFKETREYVASISRNYYWYRRLYPELRPTGMISAVPDGFTLTAPAGTQTPITLTQVGQKPAETQAQAQAQRAPAQTSTVRPRLPLFEAYPVLAVKKSLPPESKRTGINSSD